MMKKTFLSLLCATLFQMAASAQTTTFTPELLDRPPFGEGKIYVGASSTGLDLGSQASDFHLGIDAKGGYFFADNLLALGMASYDYRDNTDDRLSLGVGARYYIEQNGIYLGASAKLADITNDIDFMPGVQVGYAFFLNRTVTIEPELYFDFSTNKFDRSNYGLRIGIGINFE